MHNSLQPFGLSSRLRLLLGGLILTAGVAAAAPVAPAGPAWTAIYEAPVRFNEGSDVVVDSAGNIYAVGRSVADRQVNEADLVIVKYNSSGRRLWVRTYPVPGGLGPQVYAALDGNAAIVVAGTSRTDITNRDLLVVKYDNAGDLEWDFTYNAVNNGNEVPGAIAVDALGNVLVAGTGDSLGVFSTDALIFSLAGHDGDINWQDRVVGQTTDSHSVSDLVVDEPDVDDKETPVGRVFITGRVADQIDERDAGSFFTRSYALHDGEALWTATYDGPGQGSDAAAALALTPDRDVVVTGRSVGADDTVDFATIRYDGDDGDELWVRRYNGPSGGTDEAVDVAVDAVGNVFVTGLSQSTASRVSDYATVGYNGATGGQLWTTRFDGPGAENALDNYFDLPAAIGVDAAGNTTVTGRAAIGSGRFAVGTVQYGPTGRQQWAHLYSGPGRNDIGSALVLDAKGSLYITGTSITNSLEDHRGMLTLKYLATGRRPAVPPTLTFNENSRDRLVCRREMGSEICEEVTTRTFKIQSSAAMENVDLGAFGPSTPFSLSVGGFSFDATLAEDPRYRSGRTSAVFTETVTDEGRERKSLTVTVNWARGKLRVSAVGTALHPIGILAHDYEDEPTGRITDSVPGAVTLGSFSQAFTVDVTGRVTTREVRDGEFTLSTVTLSGKNAPTASGND